MGQSKRFGEFAAIRENINHKKNKFVYFTVLILITISFGLGQQKSNYSIVSAATTIAEDKNKIAALEKQKESLAVKRSEAQKKISDLKSQKYDLMQLKEAYDNEISLIQEEIENAETLAIAYEEMAETQKAEIAKKEIEYEETYELFKSIIKYSYEESNDNYLSMLLDSKNLEDFLKHIDIIKDLVSYNNTVVEDLKSKTKQLKELRITTEEAHDSQTEYMKKIEESKQLLDLKIEESSELLRIINKTEQEQNAMLANIQSEQSSVQNEIIRMSKQVAAKEWDEAEKARIAKEKEEAAKKAAANIQSGSFVINGKYGWPVNSSSTKISSYYGSRVSPFTGRSEVHTGIDIPAPHGSNVYAISGGVVTLAKYNYSYGNYIVIDHGGGVTSLYAHNSSLVSKVGDIVSAGQVIAKVGSTGASTGPHCHLEISINGSRVNPLPYVTK